VTYCLCAITIDKINVTESLFLSYFIISPIINELLWLLSYYTCNKIIYQKLNIDIPAIGSIGYTTSYVVYAFIIFGILIVLKRFGIIPFANDFDEKFICGTLAAVMALWMTGCNMGQSNTVTTAEETNVKIRQLRRGQPIQVRSPKCQPHPSRWRQKQMVK